METEVISEKTPLREKCINFYHKSKFPITLEPIVFLYTLSVGLNEIIRSNLIIDKICESKLNQSNDICSNLTHHDDIEIEVQKHVTDYEALYSSISFGPKILFALLAGTWSDKYGRKPLIFLAVLGQLLASVSYGVNYWFLTQLNWQWLYLELINDFCGTYVSYYIAEYSFITDITGITDRTYRLSIIDGMDYVSTSIGTKISAPLYKHIGYFGVFGCSASVCLLALVYLVFFVKESLKSKVQNTALEDQGDKTNHETPLNEENKINYGTEDTTNTMTNQDMETAANTNIIKSSLLFVFGSFKSVFVSREGYRRHIVLLGVFNFMCYIFTYNGTEGTHRYYFAIRKYEWNEQQYASYLFNYRLAYLASLWVIIPILTNIINLSDNIIGIVASFISAIGFIIPVFTKDSVWFRVGSFICMLSPVNTIVTRSVISRAVSGDEIGRIYSFLALFSAVSGSLVEAAFQKLYNVSLETLDGGVYLLVLASLLLITIPVQCQS